MNRMWTIGKHAEDSRLRCEYTLIEWQQGCTSGIARSLSQILAFTDFVRREPAGSSWLSSVHLISSFSRPCGPIIGTTASQLFTQLMWITSPSNLHPWAFNSNTTALSENFSNLVGPILSNPYILPQTPKSITQSESVNALSPQEALNFDN